MKGNILSNYYMEIGSYRGVIKVRNEWQPAKDLNRIDKSLMYRWQGPPCKAISEAMRLKPISADKLLPHLKKGKYL